MLKALKLCFAVILLYSIYTKDISSNANIEEIVQTKLTLNLTINFTETT